jgi:hypothetical protein
MKTYESHAVIHLAVGINKHSPWLLISIPSIWALDAVLACHRDCHV